MDSLYEAAIRAIKNLFNDRSVSQEQAKANLQALRDEIDILIESLG